MSEENCTVHASSSLGLSSVYAKSHFSMEDLATKTACRGVNGQSKTEQAPSAAAAAAHGVESCCSGCLKSIKLWIPVDYKNETVQFLKLAGPVVRFN